MKRSRLAIVGLVGLVAGLGGETLLFLQRQSGLIEEGLREDFRVLLFLKEDMAESRLKVIEEQLRALPDVDDVRLVTKQEALAELRRDDPELVDSISLVGDNPLNPGFEVRLSETGLPRIPQWIAQEAQLVADWADIRYKPGEVQAILQAQFYGRFIDLALSVIVCLIAALALAGLWSTGRAGSADSRRNALASIAVAAAAAGAGAGLACLMVLPMKSFSPWWGWPEPASHAALVLGTAAAGWVLCGRSE